MARPERIDAVLFDFDGTLCVNLYPKIGKPREAVVEYVRQAKEAGGTIILWTCREGDLLDQAIQWCREQEIPIDLVNANDPSVVERFGSDCRKIYADYYVDDRAIQADELVRRSILRDLSPPVGGGP